MEKYNSYMLQAKKENKKDKAFSRITAELTVEKNGKVFI